MKKDKIWIFAGTTEGRLLTRYASQMKMKCCVSTATEYGKSVLGENEGIRVIPGRMDQSKMRAFIRENNKSEKHLYNEGHKRTSFSRRSIREKS